MNKITMGQSARPSVMLVIGMNKDEALAFLETEPVRAWLAEAGEERRTYEGPYLWPGQSLEYIPMPADVRDWPADVWTLPAITQDQWDEEMARVQAKRAQTEAAEVSRLAADYLTDFDETAVSNRSLHPRVDPAS